MAVALCPSLALAQVPPDQLKSEGKDSAAIRNFKPWPNITPKRNQLKAAQAIAKVRASFLKIRTEEEAFSQAAKWVKMKHANAVETCTSIEALYHLQLKVEPTKVSKAEVIRVWEDHVRLSDPTVLEHARQAVLLKSSWRLFGIRYPVHRTVFDVYRDDPAMASFWRPLWAGIDLGNKKGIHELAKTLEHRSKQNKGLVLDGMGNAESSVGAMLIAASFGWGLLTESSSYPTARSECLRLYNQARSSQNKSGSFSSLLKRYEERLKLLGILDQS